MYFKDYKFKKTNITSWDEVLDNPGPVTLKTFRTGFVVINRRGTINPNHPAAGFIPNQEIKVPILAHLFCHQKMGNYLLDTGLDASYLHDPLGGLHGTDVEHFTQIKDENISYHLQGIQIKGVFLSHLHTDHAAGIRDLPENIFFATGKGEYSEYSPEVSGNFLDDLEFLYEIDFSKGDLIPPLGTCADLVGDGSLWAVSTPGHTANHTSFLINGADGPIFLTMDAAFIQDNLNYGIAPSDYTWNIHLAQKSLEKIIKFLEHYPQCKVVLGHEALI